VFVKELMEDDAPAPVAQVAPVLQEINEGPDAMTLLHSPADYSELAFPEEWLVEQPLPKIPRLA
jgi:hypothetical protein